MAVSNTEQDATIIEFAVRMESTADEQLVRHSLQNVEGVINIDINLSEETVVVNSILPSFRVQQLLESTGFIVVLRGYSYATSATPVDSGVVTMLSGGKVAGLSRLLQGAGVCGVEGSLSGVRQGRYEARVHTRGDITRGAESCGDVFGKDSNTNDAKGYLGTFEVGPDGVANFSFTTSQFKVSDVIGRSLVTSPLTKGTCTYGVIARSSGVFGNRKKVCQCTGETIWEEAVRAREERIKSLL